MKLKLLKSGANTGFRFLAGINRNVIPAQVTKLAKSIDKMGCLRPVVVAHIDFLPDKGLYIIDGQHLFHALMRNEMDIPYVVIDIKDQKELVEKIALLNASSKNWQLDDYITAWSHIIGDYVKLREYFNTYDLEFVSIATIMSGQSSDGGGMSDKLKRGDFRIVNEAANKCILEYVTEVLKIVPRGKRSQNKYIIREFVAFLRSNKTYVHSKFLKALEKHTKSLEFVIQEPGKLVKFFQQL
jgi:hypothetical protein